MTLVPENIPKLDLYNFEEPLYEDCDYVLTSPRSLEACSRLNIKPVDLLFKPLSEFKEELQEYDLQPSTIYFFYNEQENEREKKLNKCWEERSHVIKEELAKVRNPAIGQEFPRKNPTHQDVLNYKIDDILGHGNIDPFALRQRSRSACSLSEDRLNKDFINDSVKTLHEESMKLRQELMSRKRIRFRKWQNLSDTPIDVAPSPKSTSEPMSITREKSPVLMEKSDASKSRGHRRPKLSPKDQKILDIMKAKMEEEKSFFHRREQLHLAWDDEQKREEAAKMAMENIRRRRLAAENLLRKQEQEHWANEKKKLNQMEILQKELAAECCLEHRARLVSEYQKRKEKSWALRRDRTLLKKKLQEKHVKDLSKEEEEMRRRINEKLTENLKSANHRKTKQTNQNARKLKKSNNERFEKCKVQKETLNMQSREGFESMMASLERQHSQAKHNYEKLMEQREIEHKLKRKELEIRLEQNKKLQKQLEEEMWNRQQIYSDIKDKEWKHLSAAAAKFADLKAKKSREERLSREKCQVANLRKINLCLELWKKKTEENLQGKIKKCEEMQAAKDYQLSQIRASAMESQKMRNQLRESYERNNFDKKLLEAQLYTKMGNGVQTASKNLSSLSFG